MTSKTGVLLKAKADLQSIRWATKEVRRRIEEGHLTELSVDDLSMIDRAMELMETVELNTRPKRTLL